MTIRRDELMPHDDRLAEELHDKDWTGLMVSLITSPRGFSLGKSLEEHRLKITSSRKVCAPNWLYAWNG